jgi:hypothetical protein
LSVRHCCSPELIIPVTPVPAEDSLSNAFHVQQTPQISITISVPQQRYPHGLQQSRQSPIAAPHAGRIENRVNFARQQIRQKRIPRQFHAYGFVSQIFQRCAYGQKPVRSLHVMYHSYLHAMPPHKINALARALSNLSDEKNIRKNIRIASVKTSVFSSVIP